MTKTFEISARREPLLLHFPSQRQMIRSVSRARALGAGVKVKVCDVAGSDRSQEDAAGFRRVDSHRTHDLADNVPAHRDLWDVKRIFDLVSFLHGFLDALVLIPSAPLTSVLCDSSSAVFQKILSPLLRQLFSTSLIAGFLA